MTQKNFSKERRLHPRLYSNIPVKLCCDEFDIVTETKNLSRSGAYCRVNKYIEPMTRLKIYLLLPFKRAEKVVTKKVSFTGVIVRTESIPGEDGFNIAVYFNDIQDKDAVKIEEFVGSSMTQDSQ